jgi:hypothetical protein
MCFLKSRIKTGIEMILVSAAFFSLLLAKNKGWLFGNFCISFIVRHSCVSFQATLLRHLLLLSMCHLKKLYQIGMIMIPVSAASFLLLLAKKIGFCDSETCVCFRVMHSCV